MSRRANIWAAAFNVALIPPDPVPELRGFFTVTLNEQGELHPVYGAGEPPRYLTHFTEGDLIRTVKVTRWFRSLRDGQIKRVTLTDDEKGRTTTALECVPVTSTDQSEVSP